ncbi:ShlB/FhaC/HecB family hemolysin secretion/activation protein [Roseovarius dicentrarchi]|uniref:ShlB/FhaC/HecB family hemolysin secretion/activation protein n=1 Tax=Roseovarius dicentrarchi TaxID=2250573 RepID=UPI001396710E|nr:ShlB/FhaC/HecB family hemolysin secretion/activation protein [Roseovarius dicentrarchi]
MSALTVLFRPSRSSTHHLGALALLGAFVAGPGFAQDLPDVDRILSGQTVILQRYAPPPEVGRVAIGVEDERDRIDFDRAKSIRFQLRSLRVDGAQTLPLSALTPIWQGRVGAEITLADLYRTADAVDAAYLAAGYFSKTVVPVQDYADGRIRLQVFEGYVDRIEIESDIPGIETRLAPYLQRILNMHPIRVKAAERELLLMSDLAGLLIEGTFVRPEGATGGGLLRLEIAQNRSEGMIGLDNLGSDSVGPIQMASGVTFNDALRRFETTNLTGVITPQHPDRMSLVQMMQSYPIGSSGLSAGYSFVYLRQHPKGGAGAPDIDVTSAMGTAFLSYPFLRTLDRSLWGQAELTVRNDDVDISSSAAVRSRTRWATLSLQYSQSFETSEINLEGAVNLGTASDIDMGTVPGDFRFVSAELDYTKGLSETTSMTLRARGQYSGRSLPGAVQFGVGGETYGWAFDSGTISGDKGAAVSAQVSHEIDTGLALLPTLSTSAFVDYGAVWSNDVPGRMHLGSYGVGLGGTIGERLDFQVIGALPWTHSDIVDDPGGKLIFQLAMPF